jgi:hypothetical protein
MNIEEIRLSIAKYKNYLNDNQFKPEWRIIEVQNYIEVMEKAIAQKGNETNENRCTN